ncbi:GRP family sugar transporter [Acidipila sp. EB88]|uniref:GRP family sugar transporter n=1 Tax=Acidipila sp. EB88 TaxID=2305226 RepID=UPI000F5E9C99|nr:GRP family sugar transporter [Acidipila sp. EB88]RRA49804.1 EamA/RhaT family transporter [Acidipila sp. EB88]
MERNQTLHRLGVVVGLTAGVWLGAAEAPTKLVEVGLSPYAVSLCMVAGVFLARWTLPTLIKGTSFVANDLASHKHLVVWAVLAGALWAVANTLTVFAIRDVGLVIAFPLWNANSLIGLLWGRVLFHELEGASASIRTRVLLGACLIVVAAVLLGFSTMPDLGHGSLLATHHAVGGIAAALGASLLWGTMYVPYRKAYLSGMNPLSFVTVFTFGELATAFALAATLGGGMHAIATQLRHSQGVLFWLCLGGFVWVVGDLFQQFAAKYLGIGRGIPLSNTNQLWGLAWGALVFGELHHATPAQKALVLAGSGVMIAGAILIGTAPSQELEAEARDRAIERECDRYGLSLAGTQHSAHSPVAAGAPSTQRRRWWDYVIVLLACSVFVYLGLHAAAPLLVLHLGWMTALCSVLAGSVLFGGWRLWRVTRFV